MPPEIGLNRFSEADNLGKIVLTKSNVNIGLNELSMEMKVLTLLTEFANVVLND
ncbi:MAG: hypothetical protein ACTS42_00895 [Candidatus Hodgkinia cicadicola]